MSSKQTRPMSLAEVITDEVLTLALGGLAAFVVSRDFRECLAEVIGALDAWVLASIVGGYALRRTFEYLRIRRDERRRAEEPDGVAFR